MQYRRIVPLLFALAWGVAGAAQEESSRKTEAEAYRVPEQLIESLEGRDLFRAYCAACHGENARGNGPVASSLKGKVPDLTRVAERRGGTFPLPQVERIIAGEETVATAHGSREMPIWGPIFGQVQRDQNLGKIRVRNLAKYLESIQGK
jgi:mono/diheme cytochrome c family protein